MLPCKKRRVATTDFSGEETAGVGYGSGAEAERMEVSPSAPAGEPCFFEITDGNPVEGMVIPASQAMQEGCQKLAEASLSEETLLTKVGDVTCLDQARESSMEPGEHLVGEEERLEREAGCQSGSGPTSVKISKAAQDAESPQEVKEEEAEETGLYIPVEEREEEAGKRKRRKAAKRKRDGKCLDEEGEPLACDLKLDDTLDRTLEDGAKQHNLTAVNVRNILHEVITNEHVVAMMKAAISETEDAPIFEPKMTRSKLKEVVEKGVVIPTWNISPIKKANETKPPQFVDIPLEEDDSSDEEYQPEEEEEDETAEESLLESDVESTASSPHGSKRSQLRQSSDLTEADEEGTTPLEAEKATAAPLQRHISAEVVPMGPPPPPKPKQNKDSAFMEKLHAVDEELASSPVCMDTYQALEDSLIAFRTRSKRPLKDVPLGQLEAELQAPDITPDMYDPNTADDEEWKRWLGGLMNDDVGNEDEADDDDDPEYNFLEDLDEPDTEDFRNDRAVRITKKEVNELMEELFETFQDEMGFSHVEDEGPEDEDNSAEARPNFNTPQVLRFEEPLANLLNEQHRTVKEQLKQLRMKKSTTKLPVEAERTKVRDNPVQALVLDAGQRTRLQQQMQQHVQLLTQIHLLSSCNPSLSDEASTARLFLEELQTFAQGSTAFRQPFSQKFQTNFQPCNLREALQLIEDFHAQVKVEWSPRKPVKKNVNDFASLPKQVAWILATKRVFMYPELLPTCSLKAKTPQDKIVFTKGEDNLLALGLKHFEGTEFPKPLISKYLLTTKTAHQLTVRIKNLNMKRIPNNILKHYKMTKELPVLSKFCEEIELDGWKPPIEQEEHRLPFWLKASLPSILEWLAQQPSQEVSSQPSSDPNCSQAGPEPASPGNGEKYPLHIPEGLQLILRSRLCWKAWKCKRTETAKPLPVRTGIGLPAAGTSNFLKVSAGQTQPETPASKVPGRLPLLIQPALPLQPLSGIHSLSLQPAVRPGTGFELQGVLPAPHTCSRTSIAPSVPQTLVSSLPVTFQASMMLPGLPVSQARKPGAPKASQKKKNTKSAPLIKAAPLIQPAPVIFTVPAGAVKVVSIGNGCNVLQPLAANAAGRATQPIPITTLLVNPAPFPCSLSQSLGTPALATPVLATSPAPPVMVTAGSTAGVPLSAALQEATFVSQPAAKIICPAEAEPRRGLQEPPAGSATSAIQNCGRWSSDLDPGVKEKAPSLAFVGMEEEKAVTRGPFCSMAEVGDTIKAGLEEPCRVPEAPAAPAMPSSGPVPVPEELVLELGQELDVEPALECISEPKDAPYKLSSCENQRSGPGGTGQPAAESSGSPVNIGASVVGEPVSSRPEDSSAAGAAVPATPAAGLEAAGEKDGPEEEEEEEDFDDFTQDEEDEEMSSASEESVLSVPELQETMEKLTWLASERRLSQEGDSEEENSQEENSEPEEEEEEEEEGEGEALENVPKEDETVDEAVGPGERPASALTLVSAAPEVEPSQTPSGENIKAPGRSRGSHRVRAKRGRARASKDTSKLLLLYDEDILERDPLRDQKDLAFAQAYLSRVREALQHIPGRYEEFLHIIYEFESSTERRTAVDLYAGLQDLLREWPQLLSDFAAFLLPEQALECGLFEEQQAFEKSRKFLRQLEICFAENPSHHQKIIKVLQSCAECLPQEIIELKTQMWQLLKGHDHLQDEFSIFFDHLRPSANRMGDFEEINWTEEKDYEFDGFEEVSLPDVEEDEDPPKIHASTKNKKRKELGGQTADKEPEWAEAAKECGCSCHEGNGDLRMKRSKRKSCAHCSNKVGDSKSCRNKEPQDLSPPHPEGKEAVEELPETREDGEPPQSKARTAALKADAAGGGSCLEGRLPLPHEAPLEKSTSLEPGALPGAPGSKRAGDTAKSFSPGLAASSALQPPKGPPLKQPHRLKASACPAGREGEAGTGPRSGEMSSGLSKTTLAAEASAGGTGGTARPSLAKSGSTKALAEPSPREEPLPSLQPRLRIKEGNSVDSKRRGACGPQSTDLGLKPDRRDCGFPPRMAPSGAGTSPASDLKGRVGATSDSFQPQNPPSGGGEQRAFSLRGEDVHPRAAEATVCAKNIKVSSTGEKVVLWTREADRVILTTCQEQGAHLDTFNAISQRLRNKTTEEVAHRFRELMTLFHTACDVSSEDEEDGMSTGNTEQLSDEEQDDQNF